jgi:hypothetical protein
MIRRVSLAAVLGLVAGLGTGCAPRPEQIAPAPVSPQLYGGLSCPKLVAEQSRLNRRLAALSSEQTQASVDDAVGVLFTWRPLASLSGGNLQDQIALTKGELALVNHRLQRDCRG